MLKRIKNLWKLSQIEGLADATDITFSHENKTFRLARAAESIGDGQAVFLEDMTEEEVLEYEHDEVKGWAKIKRALGLI